MRHRPSSPIHGYAGARIEAIVGAAGVNISLLYQYFESKEKLFIAVMEGAYGLVRASHRELDVREQPPLQAMEALIRRTFRIFVEHPRIIGLLNSENVHRGRHILKSPYIRSLYRRCSRRSATCSAAAPPPACSATTSTRSTSSSR